VKPATTSVMKPSDAYERLQTLTDRAGLSISALAVEAGLTPATLYQVKARRTKEWSPSTLRSLSHALSERLDCPPQAVYAYLTGLGAEIPSRKCA
jgi:hypothetical protein